MVRPEGVALDTWVVAGGRPGGRGDPLNTPLTPASNFVLGGAYEYARDDGTPTVSALEDLVGGMEGGSAIAFSSGMAAAAAILDALDVGATVVIPDDCYQGVAGLAAAGEARGRWQVRRLELADTAGWIAAAGEADLVWLESPSNPLLSVADVPAICAAPRRPGGLVAVDNTFATPLNQRPLASGADLSVHSATKFLGGHSDLLAGVAVTSSSELERQLRRTRVLTGALPGVLEAYLAVRGARTLALRLERSQASAGLLAHRLAASPHVTEVRYPGLGTDPGHEIARRVLDGFGAVISFDVAGDAATADAVCRHLELITHATSLGAVESTIERRAAVNGQEHLPPTLLRLSVGCENPEDLWADLSRALQASQ